MHTLIISFLTLLTLYLAGKKHRLTWHIGLLCQLFWFAWIVEKGEWGLLPLTVAITIIYTKNFIDWNLKKS